LFSAEIFHPPDHSPYFSRRIDIPLSTFKASAVNIKHQAYAIIPQAKQNKPQKVQSHGSVARRFAQAL
jgi:hypothetical protein